MARMSSVRQAIKKAEARAAVYRVLRLGDIVRASAWRLNYSMLLLGSLAAIALLLAMIGVYGVLSYSVRERTQEIGVRMALGAKRPQVLSLVLRQGMKSVETGILMGLLISAILTRFLQTSAGLGRHAASMQKPSNRVCFRRADWLDAWQAISPRHAQRRWIR